MSCYDPFLHDPPKNRIYTDQARLRLVCRDDPGAQLRYKLKVLQYHNNSSNVTRQQRYSQICKGMWTNRTTNWATQTETVTDPNVNHLERGNYEIFTRPSLTKPINDIFECRENNNYHTKYSDALPDQSQKIVNYNEQIIPIRNTENGISVPIPIPVQIDPVLYTVVVRDGGILICSTKDNICN